ncbi:zona pellucida glycoprotein 2, like 2 [Paramisgurnus dabryanus]|uniref:zona pellucida glycoprotein 2, like 2 n=1 Tax=Paramisgurnus dabryanus TaxID=90735 RepID=UPI003CCF49E4
MVVIEAFLAFTLSLYLSNAQDQQFSWQMPQYQSGGLSKYYQQELRGDPVSSSSHQRCVLEQYERIACGESDITPDECYAIGCCYDGQGCYYAKAVTLQCTRDGQFVLVVARDATMPRIRLDSIHMLESVSSECTSVETTANFAIYQFPVSSCGTQMKEENNFIVYENTMSSAYEVGIGRHGSISRDSTYKLKFQCRYSGTAVEAMMVEVNMVPPPPPVSQEEPLRVELRIANGQCTIKGCSDEDMYTSYYSEEDYPVTKVLTEPVYMEVRILERIDPNVVLVLDHCWATSTQEPQSLPKWDLIANGCPCKDDHNLTITLPVVELGLQYPSHYKRFAMSMFTFVDQSSLVPLQDRVVFIHCTTSVCHPFANESCEPSCGKTKSAVLEELKDSEGKVLVSSGEIILVSNSPVSENLQYEEVPPILGYGLWAGAALTAIGVCWLVMAVFKRRPGPRPQPVPV